MTTSGLELLVVKLFEKLLVVKLSERILVVNLTKVKKISWNSELDENRRIDREVVVFLDV